MRRVLNFFRRGKARRLDDLVTALVTRTADGWGVQFISDGRKPTDFQAPSLVEVTRRSDAGVAALYPDGDPARDGAEVMYAIYPWQSGGRIFEVSATPEGLLARSIENFDETLAAATLDDLVAVAQQAITDPSEVLFQWTRPVRELQAPG